MKQARRDEREIAPAPPRRCARLILACAAAVAAAALGLSASARADEDAGERREGDGERAGEGRRDGEGERARERRAGDGERDGEGRRTLRLPRNLQQMADELHFTDAQRKALADKVEAKSAALRAWREKNASRLKAAQDALRKAHEALRALREEQREVAKAADDDVMTVLTPQQAATWEVMKIVKLYHRARGEGAKVLTPEQLRTVNALVATTVRDLMAAPSKPPAEAEAARKQILYDFQKTIYEDVLDDEQRRRGPRPRGLRRAERKGEGESGRRARRRDGDAEGDGVRREQREPRREERPPRRPEGEGG